MSLSTVQEVRTRLATLQANITGVTKAFDHIPTGIESIELPCFITRVGNGTYDYSLMSEQIVKVERIYSMQLYIREALTGGDESVPEDEAIAFIDPVFEYFITRPGLEIVAGDGSEIVYQARINSDVMAIGVPFPSGSSRTYAALQWEITVETLHQIAYL